MVSVPALRRQVECATSRGLSRRRACHLFSVARSALEQEPRLDAHDMPVLEAMRELCEENRQLKERLEELEALIASLAEAR